MVCKVHPLYSQMDFFSFFTKYVKDVMYRRIVRNVILLLKSRKLEIFTVLRISLYVMKIIEIFENDYVLRRMLNCDNAFVAMCMHFHSFVFNLLFL
jgi:hypothetical protein